MTALITGASGGIGEAAVRALAAKGYNVALGYNKNDEKAEKLVDNIRKAGQKAICISADLTKEEEVDKLFSEAEKELGGIDVLVNCAGIAFESLLQDTTLASWKQIMDINLSTVFLCCKRASGNMIKQKSGAIINIGSVWGEHGAAMETAYSASKAGISGFTKALAKELGPSGIRVNAIAPGWIDTQMNKGYDEQDKNNFALETALCKTGTPEDVAHSLIFLTENQFITGQIIRIDGGYNI